MKILGFKIPRIRKGAVSPINLSPTLWSPLHIHEPFGGAWQKGVKVDKDTALSFSALFACVTLIASDISKLDLRLVEKDGSGIWKETFSSAFSPVLRRPNRFQTATKFVESWLLSKLIYGNAYILKVRDSRNIVVAMYVLDPRHVVPLVSPGAAVFYRLQADNLSTLDEGVVVPASEIIHDVMNPLFHPLVGVSPIAACGLAALQGIEIQKMSERFFRNGARPGGVLTAPGTINPATAERLKTDWENKFGGENTGKVAVLGDGLKFELMSVNPVDAQLIEQLKYSAEMIATAFHVPPYKIGVGPVPTYQNAAVLNQIYYSDCLQKLIQDFQDALDYGLALPANYYAEFNLDDLLRTDAQTQMQILKEGVGAKIVKPNEARLKLNLPPTPGGDSLWGQFQDHSLDALARRDASMPIDNPLAPDPEPAPPALPAPEADDDDDDDEAERMFAAFEKALAA